MTRNVEAITNLLGAGMNEVVRTAPFSQWAYEVSGDPELGRTSYVFRREGVDFVCDRNGIVTTIFLHSSDERRFWPELEDLPFNWSRILVRAAFGKPARSGEPSVDPLLGEFGAWDRFKCDGFDLHVQFVPSGEGIKLLTLMAPR